MIGLTGGMASGKSTVSRRLRELGAFVADADEVSREVIAEAPVLAGIRSAFGAGVFGSDGSLDRRALAAKAFATAEGAAKLNSIMHPAILSRLRSLCGEAEAGGGYRLVFADAALLIESGFHKLCDGVWLVTAERESRIARIAERDGLTYEEASDRLSRQMSDVEKLPFATVVIENDGTLDELIEKVDECFRREVTLRNGSRYENSPDNDTYIKEMTGAYAEENKPR